MLTKLERYRPDIDGLRAIAVISVVLYHVFPSYLPGGFVGVDIFFVISGFLISGIIYDDLSNGCFSLINFYVRRIRRIFPALILTLSATLAFGCFALFPNELQELSKHILGGASFISNLILWHESGYFDRASELKPLLHLWSLGVEEQFYIFWPLLLRLSWRRVPMMVIVTLLFATSFFVNVAMVENNHNAAFYSPLSRLWELAAGAILAQLVRMPYWKRVTLHIDQCRWVRNVISAAGFGIIAAALGCIDQKDFFPGWWAMLPVMGAVLIIGAGGSPYLNRTLLSNPIPVWFGRISFPLYLWHWPLLAYARIVTSGLPLAEIRVAVVLTSIVLAALTTLLIESHLRFGPYGQRKAAWLAVVMLAVAISSVVTFLSAGKIEDSSRLSPQMATSLSEDVSAHNNENCTQSADFPYRELNNDFFCMQSGNESATTMAIVGDSHAYPMYFGFYNHTIVNRRERLLMVGAPGCPPIRDIESFEKGSNDTCRILMGALLDRIERDSSIREVVLVARGPLYISGHGYGDVDKHDRILRRGPRTSPETDREIFAVGIEETIRAMQSAGKSVILVLSPPELGFEPKDCKNRRPLSFSGRNLKNCGIPYPDYLARSEPYRRAMSTLTRKIPGLKVIDPARFICDGEYCLAYSGDIFLYGDNNHLSPSGARLVVDRGMEYD